MYRTTLTGNPPAGATSPARGHGIGDGWAAADQMHTKLVRMKPSDPARAGLRDDIICHCMQAARLEAIRYRNTGESLDDLVQVATIGLILAVDRFDPGRGVPFKHFALPTITGELKRHFRDRRWAIKVGRKMQELYQDVKRAEPELTQRLGRMPTTADLAEHLGLSEDDVRAARCGEALLTTRSLNWPTHEDDDPTELGERIGALDRDMEAVADRDALRRAWPTLSKRSRDILTLRFVDELSQNQIADKLGISQMHVSRLIARALKHLGRHMNAEPAASL